MFAEWVTMGVQIGIEAFFALFMFLLLVCTIMGALAMIVRAFTRPEEEE